ncbi:MAG: hypothetical protein ACYDCL_06155 [Myxococcales bacterium]
MSGRRLVPLLAALVAAKLALDHIADSDLFFHLRLGLDAIAQRRLPLTVTYAWSVPGAPRLPIDWLPQLFLAAVYRLGGFPALGVAKALLTAGLVGLVYLPVRRRAGENGRAAALALTLFLAVASTQFFARPLLFGALLLAGLFTLLDRVERGHPREALALPLLFAVWVNTYGGWPVGLCLVGAALARAFLPFSIGGWQAEGVPRGARGYLAAGAALSLPALLLNPSGLALAVRPFWLLRHRAQLSVFDEWSPVPWSHPGAWALVFTAVLLAVALWRSRSRGSPWEVLLLAALFVLALGSANQHLFFAVVAAPVLAAPLAGWLPAAGFLPDRLVNAALATVGALILGAIGFARLRDWQSDLRAAAPVEAVGVLQNSPVAEARGFAYFDWGGYLVFRRIPTFVDGRLEPFLESGVFDRYLEVEREGDVGWLERNGVRWLLEKPGALLERRLEGRPGWRRAYQDAGSVLWLRGVANGP